MPDDTDLRYQILNEAYTAPYVVHPCHQDVSRFEGILLVDRPEMSRGRVSREMSHLSTS